MAVARRFWALAGSLGGALLRAPRRFWPLLEESVVAAHARPSKVAGSMWVAGRVGETRRGAKGQ